MVFLSNEFALSKRKDGRVRRVSGLGRYHADFQVFIRWYLNTFLIVGVISLYLAVVMFFEFSPLMLRLWAESAAATLLVSLVPSWIAWGVVCRLLALTGWSQLILELLAGTVATGATLGAVAIIADADFLPSWFVFPLKAALLMGIFPAIIVGPLTAFILARKRNRQLTSSGSSEPEARCD